MNTIISILVLSVFCSDIIYYSGLTFAAEKSEKPSKSLSIQFANKDEGLSKGEILARQHCVVCHEFTPPDILTKQSWNFLLTYMGMRMGINDVSYVTNPDEIEKSVLDARRLSLDLSNLTLDSPAMSDEDWKQLRKYYSENAPEIALPQKSKAIATSVVNLFSEKTHQYRVKGAITSMVKIDETNQQLLIGDSRNQQLTVLDTDLDIVDHISSKGSFWVDAIPSKQDIYLLSVGDIPGDFVGQKLGKIAYGERLGDMYYPKGMVLRDLYRPTDIELADMDNDGKEELLVCSFGDEGGDFSIFSRNEMGEDFDPVPISTLYKNTGAIRCETHDFNQDGLKDIALLVSDSNEHLSLFLNQGDGTYKEHPIVANHPSWGYLSFQLVDVNQDGNMDIITTNGDNVDSDPYNTLKRFHGIRVYLDNGNLDFSESYFYPMYGCFHVQAHDYDMDGDIDIAASSFYPDFNADEPENWVYLEQTGPMQFSPKHHPSTQSGRWMTMNAGDLDQDGDVDIVLGGTYVPLGLPVSHEAKLIDMMENGPAILFLENKTVE